MAASGKPLLDAKACRHKLYIVGVNAGKIKDKSRVKCLTV